MLKIRKYTNCRWKFAMSYGTFYHKGNLKCRKEHFIAIENAPWDINNLDNVWNIQSPNKHFELTTFKIFTVECILQLSMTQSSMYLTLLIYL